MKQSYKFLVVTLLLVLVIGASSAQANPSIATNEDALPEVVIPTDIAFFVQPDADLIHAFNWDVGTVVTLNIDDLGTEEADFIAQATVADEGLEIPTLDFDLAGEFDIQPGQIITLSGGEITKTHIVNDLAISGVNLDADLVEGKAEPSSEVEVWVCWEDGCTGNRVEFSDSKGLWFGDFTDAEQAVLDISPGHIVEAIQWDEDGNGTVAQFIIPNPSLIAPADGAELDANIPEFQWEEMVGAEGYEFAITQVSSGETASEWYEVGDGISCELGLCSFHPDVPLPNGEYTWTISPYMADYGIAYQAFSFTVNVAEEEPVEELAAEEPAADEAPEDAEVEEIEEEVVEECKEYPSKLYFNQAMYGAPGPGLYQETLFAGQTIDAGVVSIWNTAKELEILFETIDGWLISEVQIFVGNDEVPTKNGNPIPGKFPFKGAPAQFFNQYKETILFEELDDFHWGEPWETTRIKNVAVHVDLVQLDDEGAVIAEEGAWASGPNAFEGSEWGWWTTYELGHPKTGHFIDSPVGGVTVASPTFNGKTDESGGFTYFPGENVDLSVGSVFLGTAMAEHKISPLSFYDNADTSDARVINMARLLQSLDVDREPKSGILISDEVEACLDQAVLDLGYGDIDFADDGMVDTLINATIAQCAGIVDLVSVSAEDAQANLEDTLSSTMFRKNISRTPDLTSSKSKLNIMGVWFPALRANGEATVIEYYDDEGNLFRTAEEAKPIVVVYTDAVEETGAEDIFAAISRDDGNTFKKMNLSRAADRTSFTLANGEEYYGEAKKPVFQVKGNKILVAWTSKFCNGGRPAYAIDPEDEYTYDDPYYIDDIWGVAGPQRSVDYAEQGFPEVGEVAYSCVWTARGTIVTQGMINSSTFWAQYAVGDIVWYKPERLTSGRRDANQVFMGASDGAGFAIAWQEDPEGLRPGGADGPGPGWGGATTSHKTDIWYSYITWDDFGKVDTNFVAGGDPQHSLDVLERPKALVPMSLPVRVTDNDVVNSDNIMATTTDFETWTPADTNPDSESIGDGDGTHSYGYAIDGLCEGWYEKVNEQGDEKQVCITADNRLLDGDTGASRPNLFLQTYKKPDGTMSAWAIFAYEETKGVGGGAPDHVEDGGPYGDDYVAETGKNAIYHSFDFQQPDLVSAGNIINLPEKEVDADGIIISNISYLKDEEGNLILDWLEQPQINYENARRPRFILQGKSAMGASETVLLVLYKEGQEGQGRPSDIMLRRVVADKSGNPYAFSNFICTATEVADNGVEVCVDGAQNMSSVTPTVTTPSMGDPTAEDPYGAVKVVEWEQTVDNLNDPSWLNPYDDARAHRGAIRGDFVVMGFSYTPNWAAARNGNDKYDFYIRRSFDGGVTWTTDPAGSGVENCYTWTYPSGTESPGTKVEECNFYAAGAFEQMRNVSQLANNKESVIEPRIVAVPGTIKVDGVWTGIDEDKQNPAVFYLSWGTATNPKKDPITGEQEVPHPLDMYYSFSQDRGETLVQVAWDVNPDSDGNFAGETVYRWDYLAKGDPEQGEAQLRMTPDGSRFYATWLQEGEEGSDIWFRRIMPSEFLSNVAP